MTYVTEQGKANLKNYKYLPSDHSLITPYLNVFWEQAVKLLPMWLAPNLVTFFSFLSMCFVYVLNMYLAPNVIGDAPRWYFYLSGIFIFMYQTLGMLINLMVLMGKKMQLMARTKGGSALGELFDHGCDSINTVMIALCMNTAFQTGPTWLTFAMIVSVCVTFYYTIFEQYYTMTIHFGSVAGPTEGQLAAIFANLLVGYYGPDLFGKTRFTVAGFDISAGAIFTLFTCVSCFFSCVASAYHVIFGKADKDLFAKKGNPWIVQVPVLFFTVVYIHWLLISPGDFVHNHIFHVSTIYGIVLGYLTTRTMLSRLLDLPAPTFFFMIVPFPLLVVNVYFPFVDEYVLLWILTAHVAILYAHMAYHVINDISAHLGIYVFSLKNRLLQEKLVTKKD